MSFRAATGLTGKVRAGGGVGAGQAGPAYTYTAATWDPANKGTGVVLSNGNLDANVPTVLTGVRSTTSRNSGLYYAEILLGTQSQLVAVHVGICTSAQTGAITALDGTKTASQRLNDSTAYGAAGSVNGSGAWSAGQVVGLAFDYTNKKVTFYRNNVANGSSLFTAQNAAYIWVGQANASAETHNFTIRTTPAEFTYSPPSGYLPWGTN